MSLFELPCLTAIVNFSDNLKGLDLFESLLAGNACFIQLRAKSLSDKAFYEKAKDAKLLRDRYNPRISLLINDNVEIARELKLDGVHLGQKDMPAEKARKILGEGAIVGLSTNSLDQVEAANRMPINYIGFGPIFTTTTKEDPNPVVGTEGLSLAAKTSKLPIVAIGGIKVEDAEEVYRAGATSIAMISALEREGDLAGLIRILEEKRNKAQLINSSS